MTIIVAAVGALIALVSLAALFMPGKMQRLMAVWNTTSMLITATVIRIVLGVLFLAAASGCAHPTVIRVIGIISLAAALSLPVIGPERFRRFTGWWLDKPSWTVSISAVAGTAFGLLIIWASTGLG